MQMFLPLDLSGPSDPGQVLLTLTKMSRFVQLFPNCETASGELVTSFEGSFPLCLAHSWHSFEADSVLALGEAQIVTCAVAPVGFSPCALFL